MIKILKWIFHRCYAETRVVTEHSKHVEYGMFKDIECVRFYYEGKCKCGKRTYSSSMCDIRTIPWYAQEYWEKHK